MEFQNRSQSISVAASPQVKETKWLPLSCGGIKTNYDGATFGDSGEAGIGVVVRLDSGEVLAALSEKIALPSSVVVLKALVAPRAAQFVVELGLHQSIFEGDSELVYKALISCSSPQSSIEHIIKDTLSISSSLRTYSFSHTLKRGNSVAHALARRVRSSFPLLVWMGDVQPDIFRFVTSDFP